MPKSDFVFGTFDTSTSAAYYKLQPINFPTPEKDVTTFEVPGRSGDLIVDYGSYKNVELTVEIAIDGAAVNSDFITLYDALRAAIMVQSGYQRLEDSLYPNEYRMARAVSVEVGKNDTKNGTAIITLDAKPQRYLSTQSRTFTTSKRIDPSHITAGIGVDIFNSDVVSAMETAARGSSSRQYLAIETGAFDSGSTVEVAIQASYGVRRTTYPMVAWTAQSPLKGETAGSVVANKQYLTPSGNLNVTWAANVSLTAAQWVIIEFPLNCAVIVDGTDTTWLYPDTGSIWINDNVIGAHFTVTLAVDGATNDPVGYLIGGARVTLHNLPATINGNTISNVIVDSDTYNAYTISNNKVIDLNAYVGIVGSFELTTIGAHNTIGVAANSNVDSVKVDVEWWKI